MIDTFSAACYAALFVLMALLAWWAFRSYAKARWMRFSLAVLLLVLLGFLWQLFPTLVYMLLAIPMGWSFT